MILSTPIRFDDISAHADDKMHQNRKHQENCKNHNVPIQDHLEGQSHNTQR